MKALVVIPDNTRNFHPKQTLPAVKRRFAKTHKQIDFIIALGLHKKLTRTELEKLLGKRFLKTNRVFQHSPDEVKFLGKVSGVPVYINRRIFSYDTIFTVGVVEPHLYAGFSGGIKCISIGLAGKKTILATHSTKYLMKPGVKLANITTNPFHKFLWQAAAKIDKPIHSLNIVKKNRDSAYFSKTKNRRCPYFFHGPAKTSFHKAVAAARQAYSCKVKEKFDAVFVGCDETKDRSLYQVSRLFNYCLDLKPVVRKGGAIIVFARLGEKRKSGAEQNFEDALQKKLPRGYKFKKPGEHRAFKVIQASRYARLAIVTKINGTGSFFLRKNEPVPFISFPTYAFARRWVEQTYGKCAKIGVIPSGFSFIPV